MTTDVDVLVIGAGIQGAGIAQAAAAAGHSVLVVERSGPAAGTSSRSSKLIHGGLRYLEQFQFGLVRESLRERAILARIAPTLVRLVPFRIPVYSGMRHAAWQIGAGLALYRALAGGGSATEFQRLGPSEWGELDGLERAGLQCVFAYQDGQTDDAALTRAVLASAERLGARLLMPADVMEVRLESGAALVRWQDAHGTAGATARVVINATGAWVQTVLDRVTPAQAPADIELLRGTHIELPGAALRANYYVEAPQDGRAVFVMPRGEHVLVGTTECLQTTPWPVVPADEELEYLKTVVRRRFPHWPAARHELRLAWAGLRVLPRSPGNASGRSRETLLIADRRSQPRLLTVCGGKLTTYRSTAAQVMTRISDSLPDRIPSADTAELTLTDPAR